MEKKAIILQIEKPWIDCYTTYSHLLSILQRDERTYGWIYSHFINLYMNKDLRQNTWGDFYRPFPYELSFYELCKWLDLQKIRRNDVTKDRNSVLEFVTSELEKGYYVHMYIEHSSIKSFETNDHVHDALIYGIDLDEGIVYVQDVFNLGRLERKKLLIEEFLDAVMDTNVSSDSDYMKGSIYSYKIKKNCDYEIDKMNIINSIKEYMNSIVPEYWRMYNVANSKYMIYGLDIYDALIDYVDKYDKDYVLDVRPFYILKDHCIMISQALGYVRDISGKNEADFDEMIDGYNKIVKIAENAALLILLIIETGSKSKKGNMISQLNKMREMEAEIGKKIAKLEI